MAAIEQSGVAPRAPKFSFAFGSDILQEFVLQHSASDIPRELVQNEFDAGGSRMEVAFGDDSLTVTGNGKPIDSKGWTRLSVVLGTGIVGGTDRFVEAKANGIGSKNFGLRSLFLVGDEIRIRSHGRASTLDARVGAQIEPDDDPGTKGQHGVRIEVPFRARRNRKLLPFDEDAERAAFDSFKAVLGTSLIKLALPGSHRGLRGLAVSSRRQGKRLEWTVSVRPAKKSSRAARPFLRSASVNEAGYGEKPTTANSIREIDFETVLKWPSTLLLETVPKYFILPGGRIRMSVSVRLGKRGLPDSSASGQYYYPLGASHGGTGNSISICAPFEMNADRSDIVPVANSDRNTWIIKQAIEFTWRLLTEDWVERFGPTAYLCFAKQGTNSEFADNLWRRLGEQACWATRARDNGKRAILKKAKDLVIPESKGLEGFISEDRYPVGLEIPQVAELLQKIGAKTFTLNSLIRLRCCPKNSDLATRLKGEEADFYFEEYASAMKDIDRQISMAKVLGANWRKLNSENKQDLKSTPSTLADDGTLASPSQPLWRVDAILADRVPVPRSSRLHRSLVSLPLFQRLCQTYDPSDWAVEVAERLSRGQGDESSRQALYRYLVSGQAKLSAKAQRVLGSAPVLLDHRNSWVCPNEIVLQSARKARDLETVLHFPNREYRRNKAMASLFGFHRQLNGGHLVAYAKAVEQDNTLAQGFEKSLAGLPGLLTPKTVQLLKDIPFLRSSTGGVAAPSRIYRKTRLTEACLGQESPFVAGSNGTLYERLKCLGRPQSADVVAHLRALRATGVAPKSPVLLYPALVDALKREQVALDSVKDESLLWVGRTYHVAGDVLLGAEHRRTFLSAVPVEQSPESPMGRAFAWLGASKKPQERHWALLLTWFHSRATMAKPLSDRERWSLRQAYAALGDGGVPSVVPASAKCLLGRDGMLYSRKDASVGRFVIDDDRSLSEAIKTAGTPCAFADLADQRTLAFYEASGVRALSEWRRKVALQIGEVLPPVNQKWVESISGTLRLPAFPSALAALVRQGIRAERDFKPPTADRIKRVIGSWHKVLCVETIHLSYRVAGATYVVPKRAAAKDDSLYLAAPLKKRQDVLAAVTEAVAESFVPQQSRGALLDAIRVLLDCDSIAELQEYFARREIAWAIPPGALDADGSDEPNLEALVEAEVKEEIANLFGAGAGSGSPVPAPQEEPHPSPKPPAPPEPRQKPLPLLAEVVLEEVGADSAWFPGPRLTGATGGPGGTGGPGNAARAREIGDRGEELIYNREGERVAALGHKRERVIWESRANPNSNYDILSVADDGGDLFLEVKSTSGRDGRFTWPRAEFRLALEKRERYMLCRVYDADSTRPKYKTFKDPVGMLTSGSLRLDIDSFSAQVQPL